jgi:hypothetical protein
VGHRQMAMGLAVSLGVGQAGEPAGRGGGHQGITSPRSSSGLWRA